jgi:hypothetical protein
MNIVEFSRHGSKKARRQIRNVGLIGLLCYGLLWIVNPDQWQILIMFVALPISLINLTLMLLDRGEQAQK